MGGERGAGGPRTRTLDSISSTKYSMPLIYIFHQCLWLSSPRLPLSFPALTPPLRYGQALGPNLLCGPTVFTPPILPPSSFPTEHQEAWNRSTSGLVVPDVWMAASNSSKVAMSCEEGYDKEGWAR